METNPVEQLKASILKHFTENLKEGETAPPYAALPYSELETLFLDDKITNEEYKVALKWQRANPLNVSPEMVHANLIQNLIDHFTPRQKRGFKKEEGQTELYNKALCEAVGVVYVASYVKHAVPALFKDKGVKSNSWRTPYKHDINVMTEKTIEFLGGKDVVKTNLEGKIVFFQEKQKLATKKPEATPTPEPVQTKKREK